MKKLFLIFAGLALLYFPSFTARFFQDDWRLLEVARSVPVFAPIANFPYRPVAIQMFYSLPLDPLGFHLVQFLIFCAGLFFLFKLTKSYLAVIYYAFNISLFPLFYWIATSYFSLAFFATVAASYFYLHGSLLLTLILVSGGLLSNEIVLVFPALFFLLDFWRGKFQWRRLLILSGVDLGYFLLRLQITSSPLATDYTIVTSPTSALSTVRWYFLRLFNLAEGVRPGPILILFAFLLLVILAACWRQVPLKTAVFALGWFLVGALPFYFLPYHMSAYYLTLALIGPAILFDEVFKTQPAFKFLFVVCYILMAVIGLNFLSQTHWIILKPTL